MFRHSTADYDPTDHRVSNLSEVGRLLAVRRASKLVTVGRFSQGSVFCSGLIRTKQTASLLTGFSGEGIKEVPELFPEGPDMEVVNEAYVVLKNAPVTKYLTAAGEEVRNALTNIAQNALKAILAAIEEDDIKEAIVVGHAVLTPAIGYFLANGNEPWAEIFGNLVLSECDGFVVELDKNRNFVSARFLKN